MTATATQPDWTKPAAMAIPKGGFFEDVEQGRYGPIFPQDSRVLRLHDHREDQARARGEHSASTARRSRRPSPACRMLSPCSSCTTCAGCSSTINGDTYFMYQGIFDTDFDKYTEDAVALFGEYGHQHVFENLEGFPEDWKTNPPAFVKFVREHQCPELPGIRRVPLRERRRDQEGAEAQGGVLHDARPDAVSRSRTHAMLEFDDIQHILLTRTPALTGRYEFLSFRDPGGRTGLARRQSWTRCSRPPTVPRSVDAGHRWVTVAFTWNGLRALGVDEASLATFPEEFKQGMVARAEMLGDTGANHPDHWVGGLASPDLHAIVDPVRPRHRGARAVPWRSTQKLLARCEGVEVLSALDLEATPPFDYAHDHFGYRDRLSQPVIEGSGEEPTPGSGAPLKAGRVHPRLSGRGRPAADLPQPESALPQRHLHGLPPSGGARRRVPRLPAPARRRRPRSRSSSPRSSWAAGAAARRWCWRRSKDDPALGADLQRNNDFNYKQMDPHGYAVPLGSHMPAHEPAGHGREHEPPPHDPPRRHLRPAPAGGRARTTAWSAASPRS